MFRADARPIADAGAVAA